MTLTESRPATAQSQVIELDPINVQELLDAGKARLIDVREPDEYRQQHIDGAVSVPLSGFDPGAVPPSNGVITILHCRAGGRSLKAAKKLLDAGYRKPIHMKGGIDAWRAAGLPVIVDKRAPMTAMQQTQVLMGAMVLLTTLAGALLSPWALVLTAFIGCGMVFAGITGNCAMANLLARMPWNKAAPCGGTSCKV